MLETSVEEFTFSDQESEDQGYSAYEDSKLERGQDGPDSSDLNHELAFLESLSLKVEEPPLLPLQKPNKKPQRLEK